jgi:hypothetical protein
LFVLFEQIALKLHEGVPAEMHAGGLPAVHDAAKGDD